MHVTSGPFEWPMADEAVQAALAKAYYDGTWGKYEGEESESLIRDLCKYFACEHALLCSSGTIGVELALRGCGVESGDEVVLAGYDFPGNFRAIEAIGARPVLVDIAAETWSLDVHSLAEVDRPEIKAVIVSHLHGGLVDMPSVMQLAEQRGWAVVEDACQQPGARIGDRPVGSWGDVSVLSFGGSKLLTAGRGGALLTNDLQIVQRVKVFADRGNNAFPLSEMQAAVLRPQLEKLDERNKIRAARVAEILQQTQGLSEYLRPTANNVVGEPAYYKLAWSFLPAVENSELREQLLVHATNAGLPLGEGFRGFVNRTQRRCDKPVPLDVSRALSQSTVLLHHPVLLAHEKTAQEVTAVLDYVVRGQV